MVAERVRGEQVGTLTALRLRLLDETRRVDPPAIAEQRVERTDGIIAAAGEIGGVRSLVPVGVATVLDHDDRDRREEAEHDHEHDRAANGAGDVAMTCRLVARRWAG